MLVDDLVKSDDWRVVLSCANKGVDAVDGSHTDFHTSPVRVLDSRCTEDVFTIYDIAQVIDSSEGENAGLDWMIVGILNDTRSFFIVAGCDFTGWDFPTTSFCFVGSDLAEIYRWGMTDEARERLPGVHAAIAGGIP